MRRTQRTGIGLIIASLMIAMTTLQGCAIADPYNAAVTPEQQAYAIYGTFTIFEEAAVGLVQDTAVPLNVRQAIQRADRQAKPIMDALLDAALEVNRARQEVGSGGDIAVTLVALEAALTRSGPALANLIAAIKGAN